MSKDVFLSHSFDDKAIAEDICEALERQGIDVWIAPRDIPGGKQWDEAILDGIRSADAVLFLLSENANQSQQAKREIQLADEYNKPLIPVSTDVVEPSEMFKYYLTSIQWIDVSLPLNDEDYARIVQTVAKRCESPESTAEMPGTQSETAGSAESTDSPASDESVSSAPEPRPVDEKDEYARSKQQDVMGMWVPRVYIGFGLALLSSFTWGAGNVVTRWTAAQLPETSFDIAVLKYLLAGGFLIACGLVLKQRQVDSKNEGLFRPEFDRQFVAASFFKGINTYTWIVAATLIPAGSVATLENMHVVWTALLLGLVFGRNIPGSWLAGTAIVSTGAVLITGIAVGDVSTQAYIGFTLAVGSGLTFALFTIIWTGEGKRPDRLWKRAIEMGTLLLTAAVAIYPVHLVFSQFWLGGSFLPLVEIPPLHAVVQGVNGLIGIGVTYFLMNEALSMTENMGRLSSLLLAIGLSFAVPFTMVVEFLALDVSISSTQWLGVVLFILGFAAVRSGILETDTSSPTKETS